MIVTPLCQHLLTMLTKGCTTAVWRRMVEGEGDCKLGSTFPIPVHARYHQYGGSAILVPSLTPNMVGILCFWFHDA